MFAFEAELALLDTAATAAASGYDPDFKEPKRVAPVSGQGAGTSARREVAPTLKLPVQVEEGAFEKLQQFFNGNSPDGRLVLVAHFRWLEDNGYVHTDGNVKLPVGSRLIAVRDKDGLIATTLRTPLYLTEALPGSYGIGRKRNLCLLTFEDRSKGVGR